MTLPRKSRQIQIVHISTFLRQGQNRNLFISMYNSMIQKIREAIGLFTTNLSLFSLIVLTVWLPGSILSVYLRLYVFPEIAGGDEFRIAFEEFRVESAIEVVFGPLYVGAILYTAFQLKQGLRPTYSESMAHARRKYSELLLTSIVTDLIVLAGLIALIIPGVLLRLRFALIDPIVVLEGVEGGSARKLSTQLTRGRRWKILGTILLTLIGIFITDYLLFLILHLLGYLPLELVGQGENFIVEVIHECIGKILLSLIDIVLFLFYWEAKHEQSIS